MATSPAIIQSFAFTETVIPDVLKPPFTAVISPAALATKLQLSELVQPIVCLPEQIRTLVWFGTF